MKLLHAAAALLCVAGLSASAQMTTVTATSVNMAGVPVTSGTISFTPTNPNGTPTGLTVGGSFYDAQAFSGNIVNGAIQAFQVPDLSQAVPVVANTPLAYSVKITSSATGMSYTVQGVYVSGTTWAFDHYAPTQSAILASTGLMTGSSVPGHCYGASLFYTQSRPSTAYQCVGGSYVILTGSGSGSGVTPTIAIGSVTTGPAAATISGTSPNYSLNLTIPQGISGPAGTNGQAATIQVGSVTSVPSGTAPSVTNVGSSSTAVLNFALPQGPAGAAGQNGSPATVQVGSVTALAAGATPTVTNSGSTSNAILNFGIPGGSGSGQAATVSVGSVSALSAGANPTVTNSGSSSAAVFNFGIPAGAQGVQGIAGSAGPAGTISVGTITALSPGATPTVTNSGSSTAATLNFGLPTTAAPCSATGFAPVNSDGSVSSCTNSFNSGIMLAQASGGSDAFPTVPSGQFYLALKGGYPAVIDSNGNVTSLVGSGLFTTSQTIQVDGAALTIGTANTPSFVQFGVNRSAVGFCSGCLGGLGAIDLQGNGRGVVFSSTTSMMANNYLGGFEASGYFFLGNYANHAPAPVNGVAQPQPPVWFNPAGVVNSMAYNQLVRPNNATNNTPVVATDSVIPVDTNTNSLNLVVTLETAPTAGHTITIKHVTTDAHTVTIQFPSGVTGLIDGSSTYVMPASTVGSVTLVCQTPTLWYVIGKV